ncbi:protein transport protein Sec31A-like [Dysidea avara]|uniref:protein transport protein Sec31A-like n=1 Tax=Dysidea avara TaxID=196820 RepID=UPI00332AB51C
MFHCKAIAWHPDVATQMITASEDDRSPIVQMWDLRFATSPVKVFDKHKRGILSVAWCPQDSDLLLTAAKDNRVLCWNPNSTEPGGEIVYELPSTAQWCFDVQWCPRNPDMISVASFDGHICVYSLLGGGTPEPPKQAQVSSEVDPNDPFSGISLQSPLAPSNTAPLKAPPKWLRRPCAANFAFGGKLVHFTNTRGAATPKTVTLSQVVTEPNLLERSSLLEGALAKEQYMEFCEHKVQSSETEEDKNLWSFLKVTFETDSRQHYLKLLGYDSTDLSKKFAGFSTSSVAGSVDVLQLSQRMEQLASSQAGKAETDSQTAELFVADDDKEGSGEVSDTFDQLTTSQQPSGAKPTTLPSMTIHVDNDIDGMISQALLVGNFEAAVDISVGANRMAEALVLAIAGGSELVSKVLQVYFEKETSPSSKLLSAIVNRTWSDLARHGNLQNWREILAVLVTYAGPEDFAALCDQLGERMETELGGQYQDSASLCYICSGNVEKFLNAWEKSAPSTTPLALQDLVEKVILLKKAVEKERKLYSSAESGNVSKKLGEYSNLLASQGCVNTALSYLRQDANDQQELLYRVHNAATTKDSAGAPPTPYAVVDIKSAPAPPTTATTVVATTTQQQTATFSYPSTKPVSSNTFQNSITSVSNPYPVPASQSSSTIQPPVSIFQPSTEPIPPLQPGNLRSDVPPQAMVTATRPPPVPPTGGTQSTWNDPPVETTKKTPYSAPPPIAAPVMPVRGVAQPLPSEQTPPVANVAPVNVTTPPVTQTQQVEAIPVQKPPIPQEHMWLVQGLDGMVDRCKTAATSSAMRRKLDDCSKKFSILYDLLREDKLSPQVLQGLYQIGQDIQVLNYYGALEKYNVIVSSSNFSEVSSFLPGVKSLLQLGMQLRV